MAFLDKYIFQVIPAPTKENQSKIEWRGFLDDISHEIVIWDDATNSELFRIGGGGPGVAWVLDGNTEGAEKYIGTNDAFDFPIVTNGVERLRILASNGYTGFNTNAPTATVHAVGSDHTLANYVLKLENNSAAPLLNVRNDGFVGVGLSAQVDTETMGVLGYIRASSGISIHGAPLISNCYTLGVGGSVYWDNGNNIDSEPVTGTLRFRSANDIFIFSQAVAGYDHLDLRTNTARFKAEPASVLTPMTMYDMYIQSSYWNGAAAVDNISRISNLTEDTLGNYRLAFFVGGTERMSVDSAGTIAAPGLQVGDVGLAVNDLYVDSAANIAANGDLIVARKV